MQNSQMVKKTINANTNPEIVKKVDMFVSKKTLKLTCN